MPARSQASRTFPNRSSHLRNDAFLRSRSCMDSLRPDREASDTGFTKADLLLFEKRQSRTHYAQKGKLLGRGGSPGAPPAAAEKVQATLRSASTSDGERRHRCLTLTASERLKAETPTRQGGL